MDKETLVERVQSHDLVTGLVDAYQMNFTGRIGNTSEPRGNEVRTALLDYVRSAAEFVHATPVPAPEKGGAGWFEKWRDTSTEAFFAAGLDNHYASAAKEFVSTRDWLRQKDMAGYMFGRLCEASTLVALLVLHGVDTDLLRKK